METFRSSKSHAEVLGRLLDEIAGRGLTMFAQIDHAAAAREVGMELPPEVVIVFGRPRAGTPLMQSDPRIGIELPLRLLVWESSEGTVVGFNDPRELAGVYELGETAAALEPMSDLLAGLVREAVG